MRILGRDCGYCGKVITKLDTGRGSGKVGGGWRKVWCSADCREALRFCDAVADMLVDAERRACGA